MVCVPGRAPIRPPALPDGSTVLFRIRERAIVGDSQDGSGERPFERMFYPVDRVPLVEWRGGPRGKPTTAPVAAVRCPPCAAARPGPVTDEGQVA